METFNPAILKTKATDELWSMRKYIVQEGQELYEQAHGRALTADEQAADERLAANIEAIDKALDERMRTEGQSRAFNKYSGLVNGSQSLSQRDMAAVDWLKSAITEKNPQPFMIEPEEQRDFSMSQPGLEYRDTLTSTSGVAMPRSVWPSLMMHLVEQTPLLRAGATVIVTATGEDLLYPKSTAFQSSALTGEGVSITESDPTLANVTLKSFGYKSFWQLSRELVDDAPFNIIEALSRAAATSLALAYGPHLATGTGGGSQPNGYVTAATVAVTGPTGTSTTFGTQGTAGQGTDLVFDLYGSLAEPYLLGDSVAALTRNATLTMFRKYREGSTNRPMLDMTPVKAGSSANLLGMPAYVDPHIAAMGANAKSVAFGDWSRYVLRIVRGVRVERSDEYAFQSDLVSFKAVIRLDGALVDLNAVKLFQHSAT
jgi:HK97 family phage major capsid protein